MLSHKDATAHNFARQKRTWGTPRGSAHIAVQLGQQQIDRSHLISFGQAPSRESANYIIQRAKCYTPAQSEHRQGNAALDRSAAVIESNIPASQKADVTRKIEAFANILSPLERC
jgi:hypothetical protein